MRQFGFSEPAIDRWAQGPFGKMAIRGREQQLIDYYGGIGNPRVGNRIRGVSKINPLGLHYWNASNELFGPLAPYTGVVTVKECHVCSIDELFNMSEYLAGYVASMDKRIRGKDALMMGFVKARSKNNIKAIAEGYNDLVEMIDDFSYLVDRKDLDIGFYKSFGKKIEKINLKQ